MDFMIKIFITTPGVCRVYSSVVVNTLYLRGKTFQDGDGKVWSFLKCIYSNYSVCGNVITASAL